MLTFTIKRLFSALLTLLLISIFTFSLAHLAGDPAIAIAGREASAEDIARIRAHYGFDRPLVQQYLAWCGQALVGDFGRSYHYQQAVSEMLATRLPITLILGISALGFALAISLPLAVEPQQVVLGCSESADGGIVLQASMGAVPVVSMDPSWHVCAALI